MKHESDNSELLTAAEPRMGSPVAGVHVEGTAGVRPPRPVISAAPVGDRQRLVMRILVLLGMVSLSLLVYWLADRQHIGYKPLFILLFLSIGYKILKVLFEWYHYWAIRPAPPAPRLTREWSVDMFTTAMPGEPYELIRETLEAMVAVRYPHTTWLCDEGNDPQLKALCERLGVRHMTREIKVNAKAGNINNALRYARGEICVILDPDHKPVPQLLDEVLPYFEQEQIGFVQTVQAYKNAGENFVARGAAEQTYTFYGPLMMGMSSYGTAQAIGANCVFRRSALDSIGGHAPGLSEDMHTAMQLHAKGWKSVYLPKILTRGLVPSNMGAYYKQQLKWSRGTFELLFMVLPVLFSRFNWRQKLHYSLIPLHFAAGIIALIDLVLPLAALLTQEAPLLLEFSRAYLFLMPFFCAVILIRQYAQRWLLERHERGLHLTGGVLLFGTWWVHLVGFVYTLFRVKVPYIPTPKEDEYRNHLGLSIPNLLAAAACAGIIAYGLNKDANPYNMVMAGYAGLNMLLLLIVVGAGQDSLRRNLSGWLRRYTPVYLLAQPFKVAGKAMLGGTLALMRRRALPLTLLLGFVFLLLGWFHYHAGEKAEFPEQKHTGGFYLGVYHTPGSQPAAVLGNALGGKANVVALQQYWNTDSAAGLPVAALRAIAAEGGQPLIQWLPAGGGAAAGTETILQAIAQGKFDSYIRRYADQVRELGHPLFISFAPECDNPQVMWALGRGGTEQDYVDAYHRVVDLFWDEGVNNVAWVWNTAKATPHSPLYPGDNYVDWVAVSLAGNNGLVDTKLAFADYYKEVRSTLAGYRKPVMFTRIQLPAGAASADWLSEMTASVAHDFPEVSGMLVSLVPPAKNTAPGSDPGASGGLLPVSNADRLATACEGLPTVRQVWKGYPDVSSGTRSPSVKKANGRFVMEDRGRPFYIKGVAYNPEHSWRDGFNPLTRKKLEKDFSAIRAMGANTIRRYAPSVYDANIFRVAQEQDLRIIYGFWFGANYDYFRDSAKVHKYLQQVAETVRRYKDEPAILAWNIGNESSGLLKHHFAQPYLTSVRRAYMQMIEKMARLIHEIDPARPVISTLEHAQQLPGELYGFSRYVPSVDVMGVNTYYAERVKQLHPLAQRFNPGRPYVITEFGPEGYWNPLYNEYDHYANVLEASDKQKANLYRNEWLEDVLAHQGHNVGGVAYCWQDRMEGSATWFGLTDYKGRLKPAYFALQNLWTKGGDTTSWAPQVYIIGPNFRLKPGQTYEFTIATNDYSYKRVEWRLKEENYLKEVGSAEPGPQWHKVQVTMPAKGRNLRLYLYADYGKGRVVTATKPIELFGGVFNDGL